MAKLTLNEMADELGFCTKTFKKYVRECNIPHGGLGRNMRFDPDEVWSHLKKLAAVDAPEKQTDLKAKKVSKRPAATSPASDRYSQMLGLEGVH